MKKIKLSELFNQSAYHETTADDDLINSILHQAQKNNSQKSWSSMNWTTKFMIFTAIILSWIILYLLYSIVATDLFYNVSTIVPETELIGSWDINVDWENELLQDIENVLLDKPE